MSKDYPPWFGSPTLIDRIDDSMDRGLPFEDALKECANWAELRSEVIRKLRDHYEPNRACEPWSCPDCGYLNEAKYEHCGNCASGNRPETEIAK